MPTVANTHFAIDLPTLFAVLVFLSAIGGLLLLFCWLQNRNTPALAFWGFGYLLAAAAAALLGSGGAGPNPWTVCASNALLCGAYGVMWGGARSFEERRVRAPLVMAGAAIWIAAFQFQGFYQSLPSRVGLVSAVLAAYALLSARELWHARDRELISRWPTLALVVGHAGFLLARIPFAGALAFSVAAGQPRSAVVVVIAAEALFTTFCLRSCAWPCRRNGPSWSNAKRRSPIRSPASPTAAPSSLSGNAPRADHRRPALHRPSAVRYRPIQGGQRHGRT